jgi:hypothetical protein
MARPSPLTVLRQETTLAQEPLFIEIAPHLGTEEPDLGDAFATSLPQPGEELG